MGAFKRNKNLMLFGLSADAYSFKGLLLFLYVYAGATLFAAALTAPVYWGVQWLDSIGVEWLDTKWLLGKGVDVYFDRLRWIPIVVFLPVVLKKCGLFSLRNLGISFGNIPSFLKYFVGGAILAWCIFAVQILAVGGKFENMNSSEITNALLAALSGGLIIGFLEELVFRGLILRSLYSAFGVFLSVVLTSLFFAYKHFKVPNSIWGNIPDSTSWDIGYYVAYYDTVGIAWQFSMNSFLTLFMFGTVLALVYLLTKTLMSPMGLHAGIVSSIIFYRKIFDLASTEESTKIFGSAGMTNGFLALGILTLITVFIIWYGAKRE